MVMVFRDIENQIKFRIVDNRNKLHLVTTTDQMKIRKNITKWIIRILKGKSNLSDKNVKVECGILNEKLMDH